MENQLPKNWINVSLQEVTKNVKGKKPQIQSETEFEGSIPYMDIKALEYNVIRQFADIESSKLFEERDVAMVWDGARSGWVSKTNFGAIGSTLVAFKPILINSDYLFYYLLDKYPFINSNARGVGIPHVDPTVLWALKFPLPPLPEQNRIVTKLDTLFQQLETIKTSMTAIPVLLKNFRQQVLTQAVTGKLKPFNDFEIVKLNDLGIWKGGGTPSKSNLSFWENGTVLWTTPKDMKEVFLSKSMDKITEEAVVNSSAILIPQNSILIVTRSGILRRTLPISTNTIETTVNQDLKVLIPNHKVYYKFLLYALIGLEKDVRTTCMKSGTTVESVEFSLLKNYKLNLPVLLEQQEIVLRVESLFAKADAIEVQYKSLKAKIDILPQALLHKAFKGELTEQLDSDGDAKELLKQIQELKNSTVKPKKGTAKKVKNYPENEGVLGMVAEK